MRQQLKVLLGIACSAATGCGSDATAPPVEVGGIIYSATFQTPVGPTGQPQFVVSATLRNVTPLTLDRTFPKLCPVRIQLFRYPSTTPAYDETRLPCDMTVTSDTTIGTDPLVLAHGRFVSEIVGDSLPAVLYAIKVLVYADGTQPVVVDAGKITFPVPR